MKLKKFSVNVKDLNFLPATIALKYEVFGACEIFDFAVQETYGFLQHQNSTNFERKKNIYIYEKRGYKLFKIEKLTDNLNLVYLEKISNRGSFNERI